GHVPLGHAPGDLHHVDIEPTGVTGTGLVEWRGVQTDGRNTRRGRRQFFTGNDSIHRGPLPIVCVTAVANSDEGTHCSRSGRSRGPTSISESSRRGFHPHTSKSVTSEKACFRG